MRKIFNITFAAFLMIFGLSVNAQPFDFESLTSGATGAFSNGWTGAPTTNYSWRANAGGTVSPGTGPLVDHTLGSTSGIYMYVEASLPAAVGDIATLTSPNITLSGSAVGYSFWYHMVGTGMGNMYIDVYNGSTWVLGVDSLVGSQQGLQTDPWLNKVVNLAAYSGTVQVRFRATFGTDWSGDMAIDDVSMVQVPPYDANLQEIIPSSYYTKFPLSQAQPMNFTSLVKSEGTDTITNVTLTALVNGTTTLTGTKPSIAPTNIDTVALSSAYTPTSVGAYNTQFTVGISENDTNQLNDSASYKFEVTDTIYARENDNVTLGIGFAGATGIFGQMFEVFNTDSLSSVSFKLTNPTISDEIKLKLYGWNNTTNVPGAVIDSTNVFTITSDSNMWYTLQFKCDHILSPGKYFFAAEQLDTNNLTMGYTGEFYEPLAAWYNAGTTWTSFETSGFNVALAIRPNFGVATWPSVSLGNDTTICEGDTVSISAPAGWASYLWEDGTTTATNMIPSGDTTWLRITNARGCPAYDTIAVHETPMPVIMMPSSVGICDGNAATLVANNDPTHTYLWSDGSTDSVLVTGIAGSYSVTVTGANTCINQGTASVQVGATPPAQINVDTAYYCAGSDVTVMAMGTGNTYNWSNGTTGTSTQINQPGSFILTVTSPAGCFGYDTAFAVENPTPAVVLSTNALQFCDNETGNLSVNTVAGASYLWSSGETTSSITTNAAGQYWVEITLGSCANSDTGMASIMASPVVNLGADTTICPSETVTLDGGAGASWLWSTGAATQTIDVNTTGEYTVITENSDGCRGYDTIMVTVDICASVNDVNGIENSVSAYPNPANNFVNLLINKELIGSHITMMDAKGTVVFQSIVSSEELSIPTNQLYNGLYLVKVESEKDTYTLRVIVKH